MRKLNSLKNLFYGLSGQIIINLLSFVVRTIFIQKLGIYYLGVGSLFTSILQIFSVGELGIGTAIFVLLFKPLAENDQSKINALINYYQKTFHIIGMSVFTFGVILLPFLTHIIKSDTNVENLHLIYFLFVVNSSISYFFSYYRALITADQKEYIAFNNSNAFLFVQYIIQLFVILFTSSYLLYLCVTILITFSSNYSLSIIVKKRYPFLSERNKYKLDKSYKKEIYKDILAMMSHKVGRVVLLGTDNIILSRFVGVYWIGLYSNYLLIINVLNTLVSKVFSSLSASIGNLDEIDGKVKGYDIFKTVIFLGFWLYGFVSICVFNLINPFITTWIGVEYLLERNLVLAIITCFFLSGMSTITKDYITLTKLFKITKYKPWFEVAINLSVSILMVREYGMVGVFIGTISSNILTSFWFDPYVLFKHRFERSMKNYLVNYILNLGIVFFAGFITFSLVNLYENIFYKFAICLIIPNLVFVIIYKNFKEFLFIRNSLTTIFKKN